MLSLKFNDFHKFMPEVVRFDVKYTDYFKLRSWSHAIDTAIDTENDNTIANAGHIFISVATSVETNQNGNCDKFVIWDQLSAQLK